MIYNKLVRDKIVDLIEKDGQHPRYHQLSGDELRNAFVDKLHEETDEFAREYELIELADVLQVVYDCARACGYSVEELEETRLEKVVSRGTFSKGILLEEILD